jgi:REP element-mobilizing transposase RayT
MITRRCSQRAFFLRPSAETNGLLRYVLGVAAKRCDIQLHGGVALSDHLHLGVTDPHGRLPAFNQQLNSLLARAMNARLHRRESFWAPGSYNAVILVTPDDILDKLVYILANPVSAALVRRASEWPGVWSPPELIGAGPVPVPRPERFFRQDGPLPATAELEFVPPPGFASVEDFRARLAAGLARREEEAAQQLERAGRSFVGVQSVLAQDPFATATTPEPPAKLKPRIACRDPEKRKEALLRLRSFLSSYRIAWLEFARGMREAVFPHGTYWMRIAYGVRCEVPG